MKLVIEPAHSRSHSDSRLAQMVVERIDQATQNTPEAHISGAVVLNILTNVPPVERRRGVGHLRDLANISGLLAILIGYLRPSPQIRLAAAVGARLSIAL